MKAFHAIINGRVQGVWFRATTKEQAERLGVSGWVRNKADGAVEVFAQGDDEAVNELLRWCRQGPLGACVENVDAEEVEAEHGLKGFSIRY